MGLLEEVTILYSITWFPSDLAFWSTSWSMDRIDGTAAATGTTIPKKRANRTVFKVNEREMERWRSEERTPRRYHRGAEDKSFNQCIQNILIDQVLLKSVHTESLEGIAWLYYHEAYSNSTQLSLWYYPYEASSDSHPSDCESINQ